MVSKLVKYMSNYLRIEMIKFMLVKYEKRKVSKSVKYVKTIFGNYCPSIKISKNEMLSPRRSRYLVRPRQTAIYLTKILTSKSLPEIGREFSNRDHTPIIHSVKTIEKLIKEDTELSGNIDNLKNQILYNRQNEV